MSDHGIDGVFLNTWAYENNQIFNFSNARFPHVTLVYTGNSKLDYNDKKNMLKFVADLIKSDDFACKEIIFDDVKVNSYSDNDKIIYDVHLTLSEKDMLYVNELRKYFFEYLGKPAKDFNFIYPHVTHSSFDTLEEAENMVLKLKKYLPVKLYYNGVMIA